MEHFAMNGAAKLQLRTFRTYGTALRRWPAAERAKSEARASRERLQYGLLQLIVGAFASIVYAVVILCVTAAAAVALVLALPWLILLPAIIVGLLITLIGAVLI